MGTLQATSALISLGSASPCVNKVMDQIWTCTQISSIVA